jgi:hypothetical protein
VKDKKKRKGPKDGPFPPAKSKQPGRWVQVSADDDNSAAGGGRRTVSTELMPVPGGTGWVMRSIVGTAEGTVAVALCFIPKK